MEQPASSRLRRDRVRSGAKSRLEITLFPVIILRYDSPAPSKAPQPEPPPLPTFSPGALIDLSPAEWTAIWLSLKIATVATLVSLPFGVFTAYALARWKFPGKSLVNGIVHLPLVLPPVVTGFTLLMLLGRKGLLGAWLAEVGIVFSFRWTGAAVACAVMGFPLMVRAMRLSFESIDRRLELASETLGANRFWTFFMVTLPLATPGVIVGAILAFAKALGEFGATITFVSNIPGETQTISAAIYTYTQVPGGDEAALRLTLVAVVIALSALFASELVQWRAERRLGSAE
jgi:molybdate transport system permease protein